MGRRKRVHNKPPYNKRIARLSNSIYFCCNIVFIIEEKPGELYRLIVIKNNRIIENFLYQTIRGAKIAFSKMYIGYAFNEVLANWTHFYHPEKKFITKLKVGTLRNLKIEKRDEK
jgi:hypothetical protein